MKKYEWLVTTNASKTYPMKVMEGQLILKDDTRYPIPDGSFLMNGLGGSGAYEAVGGKFKALPKKMFITWYSYCEEKFFTGEFDLPIEKFEKYFSEGFISPETNKKTTFSDMRIGLAPNGKVLIWLWGDKIAKEIGLFTAQENKERKLEDYIDNPEVPPEKYIRLSLEQVYTESDFLRLEKEGVDTTLYTEHYRTLLPWNPVIVGSVKPIDALFYYFNAETEYALFSIDDFENVSRPVPKKAYIAWSNSQRDRYYATVTFNEKEISYSLNKFLEKTQDQDVKIHFEISDLHPSISVSLRDNEFIYELKECEFHIIRY